MYALLSRLMRDESGATAIEYGLIAALISVVIIVAITAVGHAALDRLQHHPDRSRHRQRELMRSR